MKSLKRRLLSLFLAMVMVLSLAPGALAADFGASISGIGSKITLSNGKAEVTPSVSLTSNTDTKGYSISTYSWSVTSSDGASVSSEDSDQPTITFTKAGDYTVSVSGKATKENADEKTYEATASVTVEAPTPTVTGVKVNPSSMQFTVGDTAQKDITATVEGTNLTDNAKDVTWETIGDVEVVGTGNNVKVKLKNGAAASNATVIATSKADTEKKASCNVTIGAAAATISVSLADNTLRPGNSTTATVTPSAGATIRSVVWTATPSGKVSFANATTTAGTNTITVSNGAATGDVTIKAVATFTDGTTAENTCTLKVQNAVTISAANDKTTLTSWNDSVKLTAKVDGESAGNYTYTWTSNSPTVVSVSDNSANTVYATAGNTGTAAITVSVKDGSTEIGRATISIRVSYTTKFNPSATVYLDTTEYCLDDDDDEGKKSVIEQIEDSVPTAYWLKYVVFHGTDQAAGSLSADERYTYWTPDEYESGSRTGLLTDVVFIPEKKGTATFSFTACYGKNGSSNDVEAEGTLTITVKEGSSGGDVVYYGDIGEDVSFDSASFEDFWTDKYSKGTLEYVTFSPSGGTLYDGDGKKVTSSKDCYVNPRKSEIGLDEVYFEPNSTNSKKAATVNFSFTAHGTNNSKKETDLSGRISIVYTAESPDDITYTSGSNGTVSLKASDFTAAYKEVISGSVPSNLTIVFQSVPRNGTLTYNDSSKKNAKDVKLTSSNIKKYSFTTKSSGSNQLNDVVYSGTSGTDTIDYIAYSGSTIKFKGSVVFNGKGAIPQDVVVYYASTAGQPARFSQNDFTTANSAMSKAAKIRFVTPANGTLYLNGSTSAAGIDIAPALLYSVTYQPKAGFNGTDKVVFAAYDASNNLVANGSVNITVAGNPTTSTTPGGTTNPGGVTDVSQFTDVSGNAWYRANLATLVSKGVISGRGDGKFDPKGTVTYGEALKMVLESCGYTAAVGTGSQWAINYKNLAVSKGWISNNIDLNAAISRNATAELAAKVLGVAPVTSGSPFGDEANAYAVALYYTTPQIFVGTTNPNGGKPLFENNKPLLREQVCAVICRVSDYHTQHTTNVMPDGV